MASGSAVARVRSRHRRGALSPRALYNPGTSARRRVHVRTPVDPPSCRRPSGMAGAGRQRSGAVRRKCRRTVGAGNRARSTRGRDRAVRAGAAAGRARPARHPRAGDEGLALRAGRPHRRQRRRSTFCCARPARWRTCSGCNRCANHPAWLDRAIVERRHSRRCDVFRMPVPAGRQHRARRRSRPVARDGRFGRWRAGMDRHECFSVKRG